MSRKTPQKPRKSRERLSDRWLGFCDRVAFRLLGDQEISPTSHGTLLLVTAVLRWIGSFFYPRKLADALKRRARDRNVEDEAGGFVGLIDFLESVAWRMSGRLQGIGEWCYGLIVPEKLIKSTERAVVDKSVDAYWDLRYWGEKLADRFVPRWLRNRLRGVPRVLSLGYVFCTAWGKSRNWKKLLLSLPAVLLALPMVGAFAASLVYTPNQKIRHYRQALAAAVESRDEAAEQLYFQKLSQLGYGQIDRAEYQAAWALANEEGEWEEAVTRMRALAPLDEPGYADAHLWLATNLLNGRIEVSDRWERIETHAKHALTLSAGRNRATRSRARLMLARVTEQRGQTKQAHLELEELSEAMPFLHFELMPKSIAQGDNQAAKRHARRVISIIEELAVQRGDSGAVAGPSSSGLTAYHFASWALAKQLLEGPAASEPILRRGIEQFPEDVTLRSQLAQLISTQLKGLELGDPRTLELLAEIFRLDATNVNAGSMLAQGALEGGLKGDPLTQKLAESLIQEGALPARVCLALGDLRWSKNDPMGAVWYYERATEIEPELGAAWNNVAWMRGCVDQTRDLDRALIAANRAIELDTDPRCFETRGQIYASLKRWPEAIQDLERAVNGSLPDSRPAHAALAEALTAIGDDEAAEAHRRKAAK